MVELDSFKAEAEVEEQNIELSAIRIFQIDNGKIIKVWEEADLLGLFQQLGMELKPKEE